MSVRRFTENLVVERPVDINNVLKTFQDLIEECDALNVEFHHLNWKLRENLFRAIDGNKSWKNFASHLGFENLDISQIEETCNMFSNKFNYISEYVFDKYRRVTTTKSRSRKKIYLSDILKLLANDNHYFPVVNEIMKNGFIEFVHAMKSSKAKNVDISLKIPEESVDDVAFLTNKINSISSKDNVTEGKYSSTHSSATSAKGIQNELSDSNFDSGFQSQLSENSLGLSEQRTHVFDITAGKQAQNMATPFEQPSCPSESICDSFTSESEIKKVNEKILIKEGNPFNVMAVQRNADAEQISILIVNSEDSFDKAQDLKNCLDQYMNVSISGEAVVMESVAGSAAIIQMPDVTAKHIPKVYKNSVLRTPENFKRIMMNPCKFYEYLCERKKLEDWVSDLHECDLSHLLILFYKSKGEKQIAFELKELPRQNLF
ncbi:hypothetical protein GQR58_023405 [Nymphon striatum]|nr:hypothetical protein GQR58_023405 [Nymphon striatum]